MFTSKGLFSEVHCPYNDQCVLPNCLFLHARSQLQAPVTAGDGQTEGLVTLPSQASPTLDKNTGDRDDGRQKRQRINEKAPSQGSARGIVTTARHVAPPASTPASIRREISPPPLRLSADTISKASSPASAKKAADNKAKAAVCSENVKEEALNPRLLKQAPAPHDLRFRLLKALYDQLIRLNEALAKDEDSSEERLVLSDQQLIKMALDLEESAAVGKPTIYSNVIKNKVLMYKRMAVKDWKAELTKASPAGTAPTVESGKQSPFIKDPEVPKPVETGLGSNEELALLPRLYTPLDDLSKHGYVTQVPSEDAVAQARQGVQAAKGWEICDRCKTRFQVFPGRREEDGALTSGGSCTYHWGRPYLPDKRTGGSKTRRERKYRCCGQSVGDSIGCTVGDCHVFKISEVKRLAAVLNFEETPQTEGVSNGPVCIDGEMGYTVYGLELIRLTATAWPIGDELLDVLVRPIGEILDLNSRFSGVWPQHMAEAVAYDSTTDEAKDDSNGEKLRIVSSPAAARALLYKHLTPRTPLIGHGLENDLNALRLIHPTVIDTVLLYPHKAGLPYRNGLKMLMQQHLGRRIQAMNIVDGKMEGHDSKEDARAAGELVQLALKNMWEKMKRDGWVNEEGKFVEPQPKTSIASNHLSVDFLEKPWRDGDDQERFPGDASRKQPAVKRSATEMSGGDIEEGEVEG
ncbi:MAG: RNA exonuclease 3 [Claussenomyces sp. TS43310]|nr:MAG: RNA exonuclease 3 [Claussenomyces sp. TS43310]